MVPEHSGVHGQGCHPTVPSSEGHHPAAVQVSILYMVGIIWSCLHSLYMVGIIWSCLHSLYMVGIIWSCLHSLYMVGIIWSCLHSLHMVGIIWSLYMVVVGVITDNLWFSVSGFH